MTGRISAAFLLLLALTGPATAADPSPVAQTAQPRGVSVFAKVDTVTPYQDQPVLYTVTCILRTNVSYAALADFTVDNAVVEQLGAPVSSDRIENGINVRTYEYRYIVTPLKSGLITIPPAVLQGLIDPTAGGVRVAQQGDSQQPFSSASGRTLLDVKPPASAMKPWLPLMSLKITEDWDASQTARVGEPLTRKISLAGQGIVGNQLPDLEALQDHRNFKVYADKPATGKDVDPKTGAISGWRNESYSLIPQQPGRLVLPAIKISWWDIANSKPATAELPERVVDVLPGSAVQISDDNGFLYWLVGGLASVLVASAIWAVSLQRKLNRLRAAGAAARALSAHEVVEESALTMTLEEVKTPAELKAFLQSYAHNRWGISKNASLEKIFNSMPRRWAGQERDDARALVRGLTSSIYAGRPANMDDLKNRCRRIVVALNNEAKNKRPDVEVLPGLNPN